MSQRAYARYRGVSNVAVNKAIRNGRLKLSVNEQGQIVDADLADREWAGNSDYTDAPQRAPAAAAVPVVKPAQQGLTFHEAIAKEVLGETIERQVYAALRPAPPAPGAPEDDNVNSAAAREKHWKAKLAELEYRQEAGELVPAKDVEREVEGRYTRLRTKLLGIPSRARQVLPELTLAGVGKLEQLLREVLEELSA